MYRKCFAPSTRKRGVRREKSLSMILEDQWRKLGCTYSKETEAQSWAHCCPTWSRALPVSRAPLVSWGKLRVDLGCHSKRGAEDQQPHHQLGRLLTYKSLLHDTQNLTLISHLGRNHRGLQASKFQSPAEEARRRSTWFLTECPGSGQCMPLLQSVSSALQAGGGGF